MGIGTVYVRQSLGRGCARGLVCLGALVLSGCGFEFALSGTDPPRPTLNLSTLGLDSEDTYYEDLRNDLFEEAEVVAISDEPRVIRGGIDGITDVDVYDLGPVLPGDRIVVNMTAADTLDGAIALFDGAGTALLVNDHRNVYLGTSLPFVDVVIQHESSACYVAVSGTPGFNSSGDYALVATRYFPVDLPDARPDVLLLVFNGGKDVRIGSRRPVNVPVFDAGNISSDFAGQTDVMVENVVDQVREDFSGFDVTILSTSEGDEYAPGVTRIYFGTYDEALLGVAEGVDEFNATRSQTAIVFTDTFEAFLRLEPSVERIAQAVANVASHEIGHLLGMVHTDDPSGIMDVTASLSALMQDQSFALSPIYAAVFPIGNQGAVQYLLDTVGGDSDFLAAKSRAMRSRVFSFADDDDRVPARELMKLSGCGLEGH